MSIKTVFENEDAVLWYHKNEKIIHHQVKRPIMGDQLKNILEKGYEELKKTNAIKWLSDDRLLGPFSRDDQKWCEEVWFPKTRDAGWRFWAIVLPEKVLGQMSLQYFQRKYSEQGITARFFNTPEDAIEWLKRQEISNVFEQLLDS